MMRESGMQATPRIDFLVVLSSSKTRGLRLADGLSPLFFLSLFLPYGRKERSCAH